MKYRVNITLECETLPSKEDVYYCLRELIEENKLAFDIVSPRPSEGVEL